MNLLKRILSLLIVLVVTVSTLPAYAKTTNEVIESTSYIQAKNILNEFDILSAYGDTDVDLIANNFVRRDVFAYMIAKMLNLSAENYTGGRNFIDLDENSFAYREINMLLDMGIAELTAADFYSPDSYITYSAATKMLVKALGYDRFKYHVFVILIKTKTCTIKKTCI